MRLLRVSMLALLLTLAVPFLFTAKSFAKTECASLIGSCDYYLCREAVQPCGETGYFKAFGHKYCESFMSETLQELSPQGARWMPVIAQCLQEEADFTIDTTTSCEQVEVLAINTHPGCYKKTGFCELPLEDKMKIGEHVFKELAKPKMFEAMLKIEKDCTL
jgi:hypothetical protein